MKSSAPDKWQIFGGYSFQRTSGMLNAFTYLESCDAPCDPYAPFNVDLGGQAAVSYFLTHHFGLTYQMTFNGTGNRAIPAESGAWQDISMQSYLAGPVYRYRTMGGGLTLFYHTLVGVSHNTFQSSEDWAFCYNYSTDTENTNCSSNNFTLATGGGVDIRLSRHISVRPAQVEFWEEQIPYASYEPGYFTDYSLKDGVDGLRYSAGGVFNF